MRIQPPATRSPTTTHLPMMQHTPPTTRSQADRLEDRLKEEVRSYRKLLQKISRVKTKILCALRDEGCPEAARMLQMPVREAGASRCDRCVGCHTLQAQGPCAKCPECQEQRECVEHTRLCFTWRQPPTTFVAGSVATGVSSLCNAAEYDLTRYKTLLDNLGDASLDVESTLDDFPRGSRHHLQDRYNASRRTRDIQCEEEQLGTIETLLLRYQEERVRLDDVLSDGDDDGNDAVEVGGGEGSHSGQAAPFGLMSQTHTHYQFNSPAPAGLDVASRADVLAGGGDEQDLGFGLGLGVVDPALLQSLITSPRRASLERSPPLERRTSYQPTSFRSPSRKSSVASPPRKEPECQVSGLTTTPSVQPPSSTAAAGVSSLSCTTTTVTTTYTRTTPHVSVTMAGLSPPKSGEMASGRRRSSSGGEQDGRHLMTRDDAKDKLFRVKQLVATRSQILSQDLDLIVARLPEAEDGPVDWVQDEMKSCQQHLTELEELESTAWAAIERYEGKPSQRARIEKWRDWLTRQTDKVRKIKSWVWEAPSRTHGDRLPRDSRPRHVGHVEKVKLPTFSGRQADFTEFRSQFRELCRGERYTPVLEMAQLRTKLPKEALATLIGLQCPEEAWKRLEELYGNRELAILSALKRLRDFKATKSATHEQVIELAAAVQRCQTELGNVKALDELLNDRESVACIIHALPPTVKDKWYDREVPEGTQARAEYLLKWVETQRHNAVRIRLDVMAAQLRAGPSQPPQSGRPQSQPETTDKGLLSGSHHVQGGERREDSQGVPSARIEVKTMADARMIADRRQANLVSRKLDKCPICGQAHHYEKTWPDTQPPVKAQLLSTYLTSCTTFLALSPEEKMAAVLGNAACIHCASWDHQLHKFPGGRPTRNPTCSVLISGQACGAAHGRWYHEGS